MNDDIVRPREGFIAKEVRANWGESNSSLVKSDGARCQDGVLVDNVHCSNRAVRKDSFVRSIQDEVVLGIIAIDWASTKASNGLNGTSRRFHICVKSLNLISSGKILNILELFSGLNDSRLSRHTLSNKRFVQVNTRYIYMPACTKKSKIKYRIKTYTWRRFGSRRFRSRTLSRTLSRANKAWLVHANLSHHPGALAFCELRHARIVSVVHEVEDRISTRTCTTRVAALRTSTSE